MCALPENWDEKQNVKYDNRPNCNITFGNNFEREINKNLKNEITGRRQDTADSFIKSLEVPIDGDCDSIAAIGNIKQKLDQVHSIHRYLWFHITMLLDN